MDPDHFEMSSQGAAVTPTCPDPSIPNLAAELEVSNEESANGHMVTKPRATTPLNDGKTKKTVVSKRPSDEQESSGPNALTDLERVQRKWQMASAVHFIETFKDILPIREISVDTHEDVSPLLLEQAVASPELYPAARIAFRDVLMAFLLSLNQASHKNLKESWFHSLRVYVEAHPESFPDCFLKDSCVMSSFDEGMQFLLSIGWNVRLGLLLGLCDMAAEESVPIRDHIRSVVRDAETSKGGEENPIEAQGLRLQALGRCSRKRTFYKVGKTRIYSGYRRKGTGALLVECSDSKSMSQLADALESSSHDKDLKLAKDIREKYLAPVIELEEKMNRKLQKRRQAEILREEARLRNASRPRRRSAAYL